MNTEESPKLILPDNFDERAEHEMTLKGYVRDMTVEVIGGRLYQLYFIEIGRLAQDLSSEIEMGRPYLAEPGMVVLSQVDLVSIRKILPRLLEDDFFSHLVPVSGVVG